MAPRVLPRFPGSAINHHTFRRFGDGGVAVKLVAEYSERAHQFERMAAAETDPKLKVEFERQAKAYQNLSVKRAPSTTQRYSHPPGPV